MAKQCVGLEWTLIISYLDTCEPRGEAAGRRSIYHALPPCLYAVPACSYTYLWNNHKLYWHVKSAMDSLYLTTGLKPFHLCHSITTTTLHSFHWFYWECCKPICCKLSLKVYYLTLWLYKRGREFRASSYLCKDILCMQSAQNFGHS